MKPAGAGGSAVGVVCDVAASAYAAIPVVLCVVFAPDALWRSRVDDAVFVIVSDHTDDCRGFGELPVDRFHVACIVYAQKIVQPRRFDGVCSRIDLPPTLLGLLNWSYETKFFGQDVLRRAPDRAPLCNDLHVGMYDGRRLATLGRHKDVQVDEIDADGGRTSCRPTTHRRSTRSSTTRRRATRSRTDCSAASSSGPDGERAALDRGQGRPTTEVVSSGECSSRRASVPVGKTPARSPGSRPERRTRT
jgi:hypothetical protein